jgi:hypothetical protein
MPTTFKALPMPRPGNRHPFATNEQGGISNLRSRPLDPQFDDHPMLAVYAISSALIVIGLLLLSI